MARRGDGIYFVICILIAAGCATSNIVMKNPKTGQIQQCTRPTFGEIRPLRSVGKPSSETAG